MDAFFYHTSIILLSTKYCIFVTKIFGLVVFNVENNVVLMWSEQTLCGSCGTLNTVQMSFPCCHWPVRSRLGQWHARSPRRGELVRVNYRVLMVSLACAEKPPPRRLKKQTSVMRTNLFKTKHFSYV